MAAKVNTTQITETDISIATGGANLPDATNSLDKIILVLLMTPMGDPRPILGPDGTVIQQLGCNMGLPAVLWGLSGIGKSAIIKQAAKKLGLHTEVVYPGTHAPEDFSSLPVVLNNQLHAACMLTQITNLNQISGGLLFLDEVSCAAPAVQGAMLSMVLERQVGAVKFHPGIRIIMAANPPEYSAGGWGLEAPFANRAAHFFVNKQPTEKFIEWLLSEGSHKPQQLDAPLKRLQENWGESWSKVKGLYAGLYNAHSSIRNQQPKPEHPQSGYCWPSDRSWEFAFRCIATCRALGMDSNLEPTLIEACVGQGAATEYIAWAASADLPDPRTVLEKGWKFPRQLDRIHAVFASVTALVIDQPEGKERMELATLAWNRIHDLVKHGQADIAATHASALIQDGLGPYSTNVTPKLKAAAEPPLLDIGRVKGLTMQYKA